MTTQWIRLLPGNILKGAFHNNKNKQIKISEPCRMPMEKMYDGNNDIVYYLNDGYCCAHGWIVDSNTKYEKIKIPPMSREFMSLAVKGSVWEFTRDWTFQGYDASPDVHTIKAGTQIKLNNSKMPIKSLIYQVEEKCLEIEPNPTFKMFRGKFIPAKEASHYLKLVTPGKVKTYWRLEQDDGVQHIKKNFSTLSALKASIRVRFNLHKSQDDNDYIPEWIENDDGWMKRPDHKKGVWAVQYDHATKKEISREDLQGMVIAAVLSTQFD